LQCHFNHFHHYSAISKLLHQIDPEAQRVVKNAGHFNCLLFNVLDDLCTINGGNFSQIIAIITKEVNQRLATIKASRLSMIVSQLAIET